MERHLAAILAADVVGYSALMERDEAGTFARLKAGRKQLFEPEIERHHGRIFKLMGDGLLAEFASVVDAVECAVSVQRGMAERNAAVPEHERIDVRIGINLGEVIVDGDDRYGEGVNVAARLQQLAEPGGICVSGKVAKEVEKKLAFGFEPMGEQRMKNIAEPVPAFRVNLTGGPLAVRRRAAILRRTAPWRRAVAAAVALVLVVAVVWFAVMQPREAPAPSTVPSIAVLPFDDMSAEKRLGYLGDGVAEDIISMLARAPDLSVIARNSSFTYRGKATDVRQVGKDLGVDYVLEGSVRKDAGKVRIVAQLTDAKTGGHVWAQRFDKTGTDPWALQDEVTAQIVSTIAGDFGQAKRAQYQQAWGKDTADLEEYDYYLRGHERFMTWSPEGNEDASRIWKEGLEEFPNSSLLHIKIGWYHFMRAFNGWSPDAEADFHRAGELVRKAFQDQRMAPLTRRLGHHLSAFLAAQEGNFARALSEADSAVALAPYDALLLGNLSEVLIMSGRPQQAIEWTSKAVINDPAMAWYYRGTQGWAYESQGKYQESLAALKLSKMDVLISFPLLTVIDLVNLNRIEEAKAMLGEALKLDPEFTQAKWREIVFYSDMSIVDREVAALAKAGLPER